MNELNSHRIAKLEKAGLSHAASRDIVLRAIVRDKPKIKCSETAWGEIKPGQLVFARWRDGNYFPGILGPKSYNDTWTVRFEDKTEDIASHGHILPIQVLGFGTNVNYCPELIYRPVDKVIIGLKCNIIKNRRTRKRPSDRDTASEMAKIATGLLAKGLIKKARGRPPKAYGTRGRHYGITMQLRAQVRQLVQNQTTSNVVPGCGNSTKLPATDVVAISNSAPTAPIQMSETIAASTPNSSKPVSILAYEQDTDASGTFPSHDDETNSYEDCDDGFQMLEMSEVIMGEDVNLSSAVEESDTEDAELMETEPGQIVNISTEELQNNDAIIAGLESAEIFVFDGPNTKGIDRESAGMDKMALTANATRITPNTKSFMPCRFEAARPSSAAIQSSQGQRELQLQTRKHSGPGVAKKLKPKGSRAPNSLTAESVQRVGVPIHKLFLGYQFFVTYWMPGDNQASNADEAPAVVPAEAQTTGQAPQTMNETEAPDENSREAVEETIESMGGKILDNDDWEHGRHTTLLVSNQYARTKKYVYALASNIPCIDYKWVKDCFSRKYLLDWRPYQLPRGFILEENRVMEVIPSGTFVLKGMIIFFTCKALAKYWLKILIAAEVKYLRPGQGSLEIPPGTELIVVNPSYQLDESIKCTANARCIPIVTPEWLVQTLISGQRRGPEALAKYHTSKDDATDSNGSDGESDSAAAVSGEPEVAEDETDQSQVHPAHPAAEDTPARGVASVDDDKDGADSGISGM